MVEIDLQKTPQHVAIIMDGNGRWATRQNLPRLVGHRKGTEVVDEIVTAALDVGVKYLTLYSFSQENWKRPSKEVIGLMELLRYFILSKKPDLIKNEIRLQTIGEIDRLPEEVKKEVLSTIEETKHLKKMTLILALSYGSRDEILRAVKKIVQKKVNSGDLEKEIEIEEFEEYLDTKNIPDPDLLIRTSGEHRVSNFLLWQMAYTELYFSEALWPDFTKDEFLKAIAEYQSRERRFGLTSDQIRDFD